MNVRTYTLPSTADERLRLIAEIQRDAGEVLAAHGFPPREAHRQVWCSMEMAQLRRCAEAWRARWKRMKGLAPALPEGRKRAKL
jgi:hypothetical protein